MKNSDKINGCCLGLNDKLIIFLFLRSIFVFRLKRTESSEIVF